MAQAQLLGEKQKILEGAQAISATNLRFREYAHELLDKKSAPAESAPPSVAGSGPPRFAYLVTEMLVRSKPAPDKDASALAQRFLTEQFGDLGPVADAHNKVQRMVGAFFRTFDKLHSMLPIDLGPVRNAMAWITDRIAPRVVDPALCERLRSASGTMKQARGVMNLLD